MIWIETRVQGNYQPEGLPPDTAFFPCNLLIYVPVSLGHAPTPIPELADRATTLAEEQITLMVGVPVFIKRPAHVQILQYVDEHWKTTPLPPHPAPEGVEAKAVLFQAAGLLAGGDFPALAGAMLDAALTNVYEVARLHPDRYAWATQLYHLGSFCQVLASLNGYRPT